LFALAGIDARQKLGELGGALVDDAGVRAHPSARQRIAVVELGSGKAIDASRGGNAFRYVNHSCSPNLFIRVYGTRVEFYALRPIVPGEELTCDYGNTHHNGTLKCRCGARSCRGLI